MNEQHANMESLWRIMLFVLNLTVVIITLMLGYLVLEEYLLKFKDRQYYTQEQLADFERKKQLRLRKERNENWNFVENGIHVKTGLKDDPNLKIIIGACTSCHSAKLIIQNRATRQGWKSMIVWMQETQGLPDLGEQEPVILKYLATHYSPEEKGRRSNLEVDAIEWYILNL